MTNQNVTKRCSTCKEYLPVEHFHANKAKKDGLNNCCKNCQREISRNHYNANKQNYFDRNREVRRQNKIKLLEMRKNPCADCGQTFHPYVMEFDHRQPELKEFSLGRASFGNFNKIKKELEKCDLVCANCHKLRTYRRLQTDSSYLLAGID